MEEDKRAHTNENILHVYGLGQLILLGCPSYSTKYRPLLWLLSQYQSFFTERKNSQIHKKAQNTPRFKSILENKRIEEAGANYNKRF